MNNLKKKIKYRLLQYSKKDLNTGCWNWLMGVDKDGYGRIRIGKRSNYKAPRASAWIWLNFDLDSKLLVCHKCDNTGCINPDHLFIGSNQDNSNDMVNKNRQAKGEDFKDSKLKEDDIHTIRHLYKIIKDGKRKYTLKRIASIFGVSYIQISYIVRNRQWTHV